MKTGDKATVLRGAYAGREVTVGAPHEVIPGFWKCAVPIQRIDRKTKLLRDTDAATEVLLSEGQIEVIQPK